MKQVITIEKDGSVSGLQRKSGQGLDLRQFGKADIKRASLIQWDTEKQAWFIDVVQEAGKGYVTGRMFSVAVAPNSIFAALIGAQTMTSLAPSYLETKYDEPMLFAEYDDAVKVEIAYLDALRLQGHY